MTFKCKRLKCHLCSWLLSFYAGTSHILETHLVSSGCIIHSSMVRQMNNSLGTLVKSHSNLTACSGKRAELKAALAGLQSRSPEFTSGSSWNWSSLTCHCLWIFPNLDPRMWLPLFLLLTLWSWPGCISPQWLRIPLTCGYAVDTSINGQGVCISFCTAVGQDGRVP